MEGGQKVSWSLNLRREQHPNNEGLEARSLHGDVTAQASPFTTPGHRFLEREDLKPASLLRQRLKLVLITIRQGASGQVGLMKSTFGPRFSLRDNVDSYNCRERLGV